MDEQTENLSTAEPVESTGIPKWKTHFWPVVTAVMFTIIVLGAFGFYWARESDKKQKELESYIQFLQNPRGVK